MHKDFDKWNKQKKRIHKNKCRPFVHEREIWWCSLGTNVGFEQDGGGEDFLRPVVILKKFNNQIVWIIPLTHTDKGTAYYFSFTVDGGKSVAILSQLRLIDVSRLSHKMGVISKEDFKWLNKKLKALMP